MLTRGPMAFAMELITTCKPEQVDILFSFEIVEKIRNICILYAFSSSIFLQNVILLLVRADVDTLQYLRTCLPRQ